MHNLVHAILELCHKHIHSLWLRFSEHHCTKMQMQTRLWQMSGVKHDPLFHNTHNGKGRTVNVGQATILRLTVSKYYLSCSSTTFDASSRLATAVLSRLSSCSLLSSSSWTLRFSDCTSFCAWTTPFSFHAKHASQSYTAPLSSSLVQN